MRNKSKTQERKNKNYYSYFINTSYIYIDTTYIFINTSCIYKNTVYIYRFIQHKIYFYYPSQRFILRQIHEHTLRIKKFLNLPHINFGYIVVFLQRLID